MKTVARACLVWFNKGLSEGTDAACPLSPGPEEWASMELPAKAPRKDAEPGAWRLTLAWLWESVLIHLWFHFFLYKMRVMMVICASWVVMGIRWGDALEGEVTTTPGIAVIIDQAQEESPRSEAHHFCSLRARSDSVGCEALSKPRHCHVLSLENGRLNPALNFCHFF